MAHRGRFVITPISNPDLPVDLSFKPEVPISPKTSAGKDSSGSKAFFHSLNHEKESNMQDLSLKPSATLPSLSRAQSRNGGKTPDNVPVPDSAFKQHETPVFPSPSNHRRHESHGTSHVSQAEDSQVPMSLVTLLQESLCGRFTEMMQLHREMMSEVAARDMRRDEQMSLLIGQNVELVKTVVRLRHEQGHLHSRPK